MDEEQVVLVEAQKKRDQQVVEQGVSYEPDPAIQDAIDEATESGSEPGSEEPGFLGMGGLSAGDIAAQKEDIAQRARNVGTV
ncbi:hypothetical protein BH23ACT12_BH23ACT12_20900 [soil metagenome]